MVGIALGWYLLTYRLIYCPAAMSQENNHPAPTSNNVAVDGDYHSVHDLVEIEKERIKSVRMAIEVNDASDQRAFDYHMARLDSETKLKAEQIKIARAVIYGGATIATLITMLLFWLLFFGSEAQSHIASSLIEKLVAAFGGVGLYLLGKHAFNRLINQSD